MSRPVLRYSIVTPARNEAENLMRLAASIEAQVVPPEHWVVVVNGSIDATADEAHRLAERDGRIHVLELDAGDGLDRGGGVVRALTAGLAALPAAPDILVNLDADLSFEPDYFERILAAFAANPRLGITSGSAYEEHEGVWRQRHMTSGSVWGASRAYRWACLQDVLPLESRMGWDGIDALKANLFGWDTELLADLPFRHHRIEGTREGTRIRAWAAQGVAAHYMGYRFAYLVARTLRYALKEPAALAMISGFVEAAVTRSARCEDVRVREALRRRQRLRDLPRRACESLGRSAT